MMQIEQLNILLEAVERGSFAKVAIERQLNASSISRSIQALEKELGFRLLQRTTRSLQLTEAGEVYVQAVRPLIDQLALAQTRALDTKQSLQGTLRVTLPLGFGEHKIVPLLPKFHQLHPQLKLEFLITNECLDLEKERIDVGVRLGKMVEENWVAKPLRNNSFVACASPTFCTQYELTSPEVLSQVPCLNFIRQLGTITWYFKSLQSDQTIDVAIQEAYLATTTSAVKTLCLLDQGVAILPDWMVEQELASGELVRLFFEYQVCFTESSTKAWCVYPSRDYIPAKTRAFFDFLVAELG